MGVVDDLLAADGMVAVWPLTEAEGAGAAASEGTSLSLTRNAGGDFGAAGIVTGLATCLETEGTANPQLITASVPADNGPWDQPTSFTVGAFMQLAASPGTNNVSFAERAVGNWMVRLATSRQPHGFVVTDGEWIAGNTQSPIADPRPPVDETVLLSYEFGDNETKLLLNGVVIATKPTTGVIPWEGANARFFQLLQGKFSCLWWGAQPLGETFQRYLAETYIPGGPPTFVKWQELGNDEADEPSSMGLLAPQEGRIILADGREFRRDLYAARRPDKPGLVTTLPNGLEDVSDLAAKQMFDNVGFLTARGATGDTYFLNGSTWTGPTNGRAYGGIIEGLAKLHTHRGLSRDYRSAPVELAKYMADLVIDTQQPSGQVLSLGTSDAIFVWNNLITAYRLLRTELDEETRERWADAIIALAGYVHSVSERGFYINGNLELHTTIGLWELYDLTGDAAWLAASEDQWIRAINPPANMNSARGTDPASHGYGLRLTADGTLVAIADLMSLDPEADAVYLGEQTGANDAGKDYSYSNVAAQFAWHGYKLTGNARYLQLCRLLILTYQERVNTSTWVFNATGGSRVNSNEAFLPTMWAEMDFAGLADFGHDWVDQFKDQVLPNFKASYNSANYVNGLAILGDWIGLAELET